MDRRRERDLVTVAYEWAGRVETVFAVAFIFWTQKNQQFHAEPFFVKRGRSESEDKLLAHLLQARAFCTTGPVDPFFMAISQVERVSGRRLRSRDVNELMKVVAQEMGFNPADFSTTSNRVAGMTTLCNASGVVELEVIKKSKHASFQTVRRHYRFPVAHTPRSERVVATELVGLTTDAGFSTDDLVSYLALRAEVRVQEKRGCYASDRRVDVLRR
jgi:hypothetical protein